MVIGAGDVVGHPHEGQVAALNGFPNGGDLHDGLASLLQGGQSGLQLLRVQVREGVVNLGARVLSPGR